MIFDQLSESEPYRKLSEHFAAAFDYLSSRAFETVADGRYEVVGDDVMAMVQSYQSKPVEQGRWEAHRHYADIQYIVSGVERMGVAPLPTMTVQQPYSRETDCEFFIGQGQFIRVERGFFALFLPQDVHMPGIAIEQSVALKKVVMKVRIR